MTPDDIPDGWKIFTAALLPNLYAHLVWCNGSQGVKTVPKVVRK
ncbi:hypothetical protein [Armatimonas sp.]|nr:hypothetical protein [Armatimonas sp.]